ncbi:potassium transporter TrkA [Pseudonocardiaceae bacterium YIM PH 21723]|nr:potassium transporter TrkA [Pseudonocardiaceae bacterium YIM PH 21723]
MNVEVTPLPGIGTRQDFIINNGRRIGVITCRDGSIQLILSKQDDPDSCTASIPLSTEEANTLASLLGAPNLVAKLNANQEGVDGVSTRQYPISAGSSYVGRSLGDTAMRTRTGCSIVAVVRAGSVSASPRPDFVFAPHDLVVVVGTDEGLRAAEEILNQD